MGLGLLGVGAGGALLARWPGLRGRLPAIAGGYALSLIAAWGAALALPIRDPSLEAGALLHLGAYAALTGLPFLTGGLLIGGILSARAEDAHEVYGADLIGAGLGCLLAPMALEQVGAGGAAALALALAGGGWAAVAPGLGRLPGIAVAAVGLWLASPGAGTDARWPAPSKLTEAPEWSAWTANSRIDLLPVEARTIFGRGRNTDDIPIPEQGYICQDGSACTYITDFSSDEDALALLDLSLYSAALRLTWAPRVLVIGAGGGNDLWAAKAREATLVRGVELNAPILEVHQLLRPHFSRDLILDPRVQIRLDEGRSALERETERFDVVQMSGIDTWTALASGAYALAENYLYTQEAMEAMLARLDRGGILQIVRMAAEMETLRLLSTLRAASPEGFAEGVAVIGSPDRLVAVLRKDGAFSRFERMELERFCREAGLDPLYLPGRRLGTAAESFVLSEDPGAFIQDFPRDISPTTDDRPYFFHFTRWSDLLGAADHVREPTYVSQGNPLFVLGHLGLSALLASLVIAAPLGRLRGADGARGLLGPALIYFAGLGAGFIALEVALIQQLTLLLGQPVYSLAVTLCSLLVASGVGSLLSRDLTPAQVRWVFPGILLLAAAVAWGAGPLTELALPWPLSRRSAAAAVAAAPVGLLMGAPFAWGLRRLNGRAPALVPWAWAINGGATAVGAVLAAAISITVGFDAAMICAGGIYLAAWGLGGRRL